MVRSELGDNLALSEKEGSHEINRALTPSGLFAGGRELHAWTALRSAEQERLSAAGRGAGDVPGALGTTGRIDRSGKEEA